MSGSRVYVIASATVATCLLISGCGARADHQSMAATSDRAMRDAQRQGLPLGTTGHGGQGHGASMPAEESSAAAPALDPSTHASHEMAPHEAARSEAAQTPHEMGGMASMGTHSAASPHAHPAATVAPHAMPGMNHVGGVTAERSHTQGSMEHTASISPAVGVRLAVVPDALDEPAAVSVLEAQRGEELGSRMATMSGMHAGATYRQVDAGRKSEPPPPSHEHDPQEPPQ